MQKLKSYNFIGYVDTLEPMTISVKDAAQGAVGHRLPRNGSTKDAEPYIHAPTVRGKLRHAAHKMVLRAVKKKNNGVNPLTLADFFMLAQGVDINNSLNTKSDGITDFGCDIRDANPVISAFGRWGLESRFCPGGLFLTDKTAFGMYGGGSRGIMFERDPSLMDELNQEDQDRLFDILKEQTDAAGDIGKINSEIDKLTRQLRTVAKDEKAAINEKIVQLKNDISARKDEKSGPRETIRRPIDAFEAIAANTRLSNRMSLNSATPQELGLILLTLREVARNPQMGGHKAYNFGKFKASWTVTHWPEDSDNPIEIGSVSFDETGFNVTGEELKEAIAHWEDHISECDFSKA